MRFYKTYCILSFLFIYIVVNAQYPSPKVRYTSFNVNTGNIEIRWEPSVAPGVTRYEVRYYNPGLNGGLNIGWRNIGFVDATDDRVLVFSPADFEYVNPLEEPVQIGVKAWDINGDIDNLGINKFDSTIFLQAEYDSCQASANLTWSPYNYKQWNQPGTSEYRIYVSNNGGTNYSLNSTLASTSREHTISNLQENQDYIIFVTAISRNNSGDSANSNPVYINTDMSVLPGYMNANFATYNNGAIDISFSIDPLSETNTYNLLRSKEPTTGYEQIDQFIDNAKEINTTDFVNYFDGPYYYKLEVVNYCDVNIRESDNIASSIILNREGSALAPVLNWNEYREWNNGISSYSLERKFGNTDFIEIANISSTTYTDSELEGLVENNYAAEVCYRLTAHENAGSYSSTANPICYELPPNIRFEFDAFMPGSGTGNDTFGPIIDFIPNEYVFRVLDRSGRKVYESKDPENTRWDGYINGSLAPQGAYMAIIQYRMSDGKRQVLQGAVAVVY